MTDGERGDKSHDALAGFKRDTGADRGANGKRWRARLSAQRQSHPGGSGGDGRAVSRARAGRDPATRGPSGNPADRHYDGLIEIAYLDLKLAGHIRDRSQIANVTILGRSRSPGQRAPYGLRHSSHS
jgi:hypothetical protein